MFMQVAAVIGCGAVSSIGCQGSQLAVEREWVKALCAGDSVTLARKNSGNPSSIHEGSLVDARSGFYNGHQWLLSLSLCRLGCSTQARHGGVSLLGGLQIGVTHGPLAIKQM